MGFLDLLGGLFNYWAAFILLMAGLYITITRRNLVKKIVGLNVFQTAVFVLYISMGKLRDGGVPIIDATQPDVLYSNPLPHVLILTAIVVGVATTAVGLALIVRINEAFGSIEEHEIEQKARQDGARQA